MLDTHRRKISSVVLDLQKFLKDTESFREHDHNKQSIEVEMLRHKIGCVKT